MKPARKRLHLPALLRACLFVACLLVPALAMQEKKKPTKEGLDTLLNPRASRSERLAQEAEGSWMLLQYKDPQDAGLEDKVSGFLTFHDGFLTLIIAIETYENRLFRSYDKLIVQSGAYRYRFDPEGNLQVTNVMSFTNLNDDGEMEREPTGDATEYFASIQDGVLDLRGNEGLQISFRKISSGEFPASAIRKLESRRGGQPRWEIEGEEPR